MDTYSLKNVAAAGCGPCTSGEVVTADSMEEALMLWIGHYGWVELLNNSLATTHLARPTGQAPQIHPAAPGRWYAGAVCLTGPVEKTREEWELVISRAVAAAQEHHRLHPPKLPEYTSRRSRYRKKSTGV